MEIIKNEVKQIKQFIKEHNILSKEILTLEEAAVYLQLSKSSVYKLTSNKEVPYYVPGGKKIYFRRPELDEWIFNSRVSTTMELESSIDTYLSNPLKTKI